MDTVLARDNAAEVALQTGERPNDEQAGHVTDSFSGTSRPGSHLTKVSLEISLGSHRPEQIVTQPHDDPQAKSKILTKPISHHTD